MTMLNAVLASKQGASSNFRVSDDFNMIENTRSAGITPLSASLQYAWLWQILAQQNSSLKCFNIDDLTLLQGIDGASSSGCTMPFRIRSFYGISSLPGPTQLQPQTQTLQSISLAQARKQALLALHRAEERRQKERESEAHFWTALEDEA